MSRRHARRIRIAAAAIVLLPLSLGCESPGAAGSDGEGLEIVATQVPAGRFSDPIANRLDLGARYPEGSRVVLVSGAPGSPRIRVLSDGLIAAGAPDLSADADSVLFIGRATGDGPWSVYESDLRRPRKPMPVVQSGADCSDPAYLPGDRIVVACADATPSGARSAGGWSLYTAPLRGSEIERITFGPGSAFDPTGLGDGRLLFSMWQGPGAGRPDSGATALFTLHPDGTLLHAFSDSHGPPVLKMRARETDDAGIVYIGARRDGGEPRIHRLDSRRPQSAAREMAPSFDPLAAEPLPGGRLLVTGLLRGVSGGEAQRPHVYLWPQESRAPSPLFELEGWEEVEAVPRIRTPRSPVLPTAVDRSQISGRLLCYDARRSDGVVGPTPGAPHPLTLKVHTLEASSPNGAPAELGLAEIESDGSFFIQVPADRPVRIATLTEDGSVISSSDWFWVRPGEVRACFGCHESREAAPVNRLVRAISHPALEPATGKAVPGG